MTLERIPLEGEDDAPVRHVAEPEPEPLNLDGGDE